MIKKAAIFYKWKIYTWKRHSDCIKAAHQATKDKPIIGIQGFITDTGKFLNRTQAAQEALACKQIQTLKYSKTELFSEDLY